MLSRVPPTVMHLGICHCYLFTKCFMNFSLSPSSSMAPRRTSLCLQANLQKRNLSRWINFQVTPHGPWMHSGVVTLFSDKQTRVSSTDETYAAFRYFESCGGVSLQILLYCYLSVDFYSAAFKMTGDYRIIHIGRDKHMKSWTVRGAIGMQ